MPKQQQRSHETKDLILKAVCNRLLLDSSEDLRIVDICEDTGLSATGIYSYFGSRRGIVDAAFIKLYQDQHDLLRNVIAHQLSVSESTEGFMSNMLKIRTESFDTLKTFRNLEVIINARAITYDDFCQLFKPVKTQCLEELTMVVENFRDKGLFDSKFSSKQLTLTLLGAIMLRGIHEITLGTEDINPTWSLLMSSFGASQPLNSQTPPLL